MNRITPNKKAIITGFLFLFFTLSWLNASAHDVFSGNTQATVQKDSGLTLRIYFATETLHSFMDGLSDRDNQISSANLNNIREYLSDQARRFYHVELNGKPLAADTVQIQILDQQEEAFITVDYPGPIGGRLLLRGDFIEHTSPEYLSTLNVVDGQGRQLGLFIQTHENHSSEVLIAGAGRNTQNTSTVFGTFLYQGIFHILSGIDHLLFLMALLIVCHNWRSAVVIISSFTVAHTITLCLSVMNVVTPPAQWIEVIIAFTIIYLGVENFWTAHKPRVRWLLTAVFGLAHGFGFANALRESGLGTEGAPIAAPLLAFNLGVELGQLMLALIFIPLLWQAQKFKAFTKFIQPAVSASVIFAGAFWAFERILA